MYRFVVFTCMALGLISVRVSAEEQEVVYPWTISVVGGIAEFEGDEAVDDGDIYSVIVGYALNDIHRIEAGVFLLDNISEDFRYDIYEQDYVSRLEEAAGVNETSGWGMSLESVWRLGHKTRFDPHVALGIGFVDYEHEFDDTPELTFRGGLGFLYHFNDALALRADARALVAGTDSEVNGHFTAGITWTPPIVMTSMYSEGQDSDALSRKDATTHFEPTISFEGAGAELREEYFSELDIVGRVLGQGSFERVTIESHVFVVAGDKASDVSQQRADAVMSYLVSKWNLNADMISAVGVGDKQPLPAGGASSDRIVIFAH